MAQGGRFGSIPQAASSEGYDAIVQQLLEAGADVRIVAAYSSRSVGTQVSQSCCATW